MLHDMRAFLNSQLDSYDWWWLKENEIKGNKAKVAIWLVTQHLITHNKRFYVSYVFDNAISYALFYANDLFLFPLLNLLLLIICFKFETIETTETLDPNCRIKLFFDTY